MRIKAMANEDICNVTWVLTFDGIGYNTKEDKAHLKELLEYLLDAGYTKDVSFYQIIREFNAKVREFYKDCKYTEAFECMATAQLKNPATVSIQQLKDTIASL